MEWQIILALLLGSLVVLMISGMPVAFCLLLISVVGVIVFWGGQAGLNQLAYSIQRGIGKFTLLAIPLFVLMGELMFNSGIGGNMIEALDKWLGRLPGRLGLLAVAAGTLFATCSGSTIASVALLGSTLTPEMEKRGYKKAMSLGPIAGCGCLAMMIPPSALAVLFCAIAETSVGETLVAIILPGLLMAVLYAVYIIGRCYLQPSIAPAYKVPPTSMSEKLVATVRYVLPLGFVIFAVIGLMMLGFATPTEAAAMGVLTTLILAASQKRLTWRIIQKSFMETVVITTMIGMIIAAATAFSQILAFSGASKGLLQSACGLPISPILIIISMQVAGLFLGMFLDSAAILMICLPIFMPIIEALGFDPVWFAVVFLINIETGLLSPPFGILLFVVRGIAPSGTTMGDIIRATLPFVCCDLVAMALVIAFPQIALFLPGVMK